MTGELPASALKVQAALADGGYDIAVVEMPASTRTAGEAADAVGTTIAQIAKSIVFRARNSGRAVLVITSGVNRVDEKKVKALLGESLGRADPDFVREKTGFAIGGVPPVGHAEAPVIFVDQDLMKFDEIWAAAGTPRCVFRCTPDQIMAMTGGTAGDVRQDA